MRGFHSADGEHAVLLLHGLMGNPLEMQYLSRRFQRTGLVTRVPHLEGYGYGQPGKRFVAQTWQQWHAQVLEHFDAMKQQYRTVSVCGLCIGAVLALNLAAERGAEVSALSLLATTLAYDGWSMPWYQFLTPLAMYTPLRHLYSYREREPYGFKNEAVRRWIAREMADKGTSAAGAAKLPMTAVHQAHLLIRHVRRVLPRVTVPTLVMHAMEDDVASPRSAEFVIDHIGTRDVRLELLHDSYHMITMDNEKQRVAEETERFFRDRARSHAAAVDPRKLAGLSAVKDATVVRLGSLAHAHGSKLRQASR